MIKYNLERLALEAILNDGTYNGDWDWWTSFTTDEGKVYDVNVHHPDVFVSYVRITIYDCIEQDGNFITDTESEAGFLEIQQSLIMPDKEVKNYRVPFKFVTEYYIDVKASDPIEAEQIVNEMEDKNDLINNGTFKEIGVEIANYYEIEEIEK